MASNQKRRVLLVGATGMLGGEIADAILSRSDLVLRALVRPGKAEAAAALRGRGAEIAEGDVADAASLAPAMAGVDVIVCALPNDPRVFVPGHRNLLDAAERAGVSRMIPSDFSVDFFNIGPDENDNLAMRKEVVPLFAGRSVRPSHILIGAFMDTMLDPRAPFIDWATGTLPYFGDGQQACDFTSVRDAARYVAAACADANAPEILKFAGDVRTMPGLAVSIGRAFRKPLSAKSQGSVSELARLIDTKKASAADPWEWISLQYHHNMVSGRAKLDPLDNARYPEVGPESVETFAARVGEGNARGMSHSA